MAEFVTITVHPSVQEGESLTVHDAMQQVLDVINLLEQAADAAVTDGPKIVWRLHSATTNSPFSVRAEGASSDPSVSVAIRAIQAKRVVARSLAALTTDEPPPAWMNTPALKTAKRVADRNLNGIGKTEIDSEGDAERITLVPYNARTASNGIARALLEEGLLEVDQSHTEYGSAEGVVLAATTYYRHPAIYLKERLSGDRVICVFTSEAAQEAGSKNSLDVVWGGKRILVHGALHYDSDGQIVRIDVNDFQEITVQFVDLNEMRALDITRGLSPNAYLDMLRENDFND